ncbi:hypothetical protein BCON_0245g00100 [Botryotinia convoluta]|uniref:Uncharacterized protein n=1 Tax=Botryotinia convoluta TaxID=54673 RepID=A0A4Z1HI89_9HELO|nr:hypothetical protein BCON_0245g00100 [Botryotinia convoluta]
MMQTRGKLLKQVMRILVAALGMKMELITSDAHTRRSSRNGGVITTNHPAKNTKKKTDKKTDKKGGDSAGERKGSRFRGALSDLRSKVMRG